ncbi:hypothetical protein IWW34DRAFT_796168 [Fusarium oxysporum f. sp. albedinis]|nr:hypothetical protein IWW34DRAFT_796168 [Fusarium oxysporum f. sp. albedinis]KAK2670398.1 hypothetical protein RAB80_014535 [Fusarium oxysporum f. sp. vasinfectum]KAK2471024.1 hypothetical protein H9L39_17255 [Fusarium oxysporum f. sp. albedinis]KAK2675233.1 hypothetical protein RAB80_010217 [Fusarium oxysporum f. sp. vasinfectum]KAK2680397.1 hypothetical protein RAB80_002190 [Fusarium oxysporum f. sp. vasinfectum]
MTEAVALKHNDTQKKLTQRARNREAQARRRTTLKANEDTITVLRWGLREIARATWQGDFLHVQTILKSLDPSLMSPDPGSVALTLQLCDSFPDTASVWGASSSLLGTTDFNLPLSPFTNFGTIGQERPLPYQMVSEVDSWSPSTNINQVPGTITTIN